MNTLYKEYRSCGYIDTKSLAVPAAPSYWVRAEIYIVKSTLCRQASLPTSGEGLRLVPGSRHCRESIG